MKGRFFNRKFTLTLPLAFLMVGLCSCQPKEEETEQCYRLTETGARMANEALNLQKKQEKIYKKWGLYPSDFYADGDTSIDAKPSYSKGDILDESTEPKFVIKGSEINRSSAALDELFLVGTHDGDVLNGKGMTQVNEPILYPSATDVSDELSAYDLNVDWFGDHKVNIDRYNYAQKCILNYRLINHSGRLSNNNYETNLHFSVILKNDSDLVRDYEYSTTLDWKYSWTNEEMYRRFMEHIKSTYHSYKHSSKVNVSVFNLAGEELTYDVFKATIESATKDKTMAFTLKYRAYDADGNSTEMLNFHVKLYDDDKPYAIDANGNVISSIALCVGEINYCPEEVLNQGVRKRLDEMGVSFVDDADGKIEPKVRRCGDGVIITAEDASGNKVEFTDKTLRTIYKWDMEFDDITSCHVNCSGVSNSFTFEQTRDKVPELLDSWCFDLSETSVVANEGTDFEAKLRIDAVSLGLRAKTSNIVLDTLDAGTIILNGVANIRVLNVFVGNKAILNETSIPVSFPDLCTTNVYFECSEEEYEKGLGTDWSLGYRFYYDGTNSWLGTTRPDLYSVNKFFNQSKDSFKTAVGWTTD